MNTWLFIISREIPMRRSEDSHKMICQDPQKLKWIVTAPTYLRAYNLVVDRLQALGTSFAAIKQTFDLTDLLGGIDEEITIGALMRGSEENDDDPVPSVRRLIDRRYAHLWGG